MTAITKQEIAALPVEFKLNGKAVVGRADETIIQTAKHHGIDIPHLCYKEGLRPDGNCRACMVEIKGERVLAPSCCRTPSGRHGGAAATAARGRQSQKMVLELLLSDMPEQDLHARHQRTRPLGDEARAGQAALRAARADRGATSRIRRWR